MPRFLGDLRETVVTTLPATGSDGSIVYNTTDDKYYTWDGANGEWVPVGGTNRAFSFMMGD